MNIIVTIKVNTSDKYYDLSLPDDKVINELVEEILSLLNYYDKSFLPFEEIQKIYSKMHKKYISFSNTLKTADIITGDIIYLE